MMNAAFSLLFSPSSAGMLPDLFSQGAVQGQNHPDSFFNLIQQRLSGSSGSDSQQGGQTLPHVPSLTWNDGSDSEQSKESHGFFQHEIHSFPHPLFVQVPVSTAVETVPTREGDSRPIDTLGKSRGRYELPVSSLPSDPVFGLAPKLNGETHPPVVAYRVPEPTASNAVPYPETSDLENLPAPASKTSPPSDRRQSLGFIHPHDSTEKTLSGPSRQQGEGNVASQVNLISESFKASLQDEEAQHASQEGRLAGAGIAAKESTGLIGRSKILQEEQMVSPDPENPRAALGTPSRPEQFQFPSPAWSSPLDEMNRRLGGGASSPREFSGREAVGPTLFMKEQGADPGGPTINGMKDLEEGGIPGTGTTSGGGGGVQSGLTGFSQSQSGYSPSSSTMAGDRLVQESGKDFHVPTLNRLQLEVQVSESQRVHIDVGVQQRQVYAGLVMDHTALRNLALQYVPQLEEQLANMEMELSQFSAETRDHSEFGEDSPFTHGRKARSEGERSFGVSIPAPNHDFLTRPWELFEQGLHFVA